MPVLNDQEITKLFDRHIMPYGSDVLDFGYYKTECVQPASLDIPIPSVATQITASFLPKEGQSIIEFLEDESNLIYQSRGNSSVILSPGMLYLFDPQIRFDLPETTGAYFSPRSSIGRTDIQVRMIADGVQQYNYLPPGFKGQIRLEVVTRHFSIHLPYNMMNGRHGYMRVGQLRFSRPSENGVEVSLAPKRLHIDLMPHEDGQTLLMAASPRHNSYGSIIRLGPREEKHRKGYYWNLEYDLEGTMYLPPDRMVLVRTIERIKMPATQCGVVQAYNDFYGDFRSHYAGFIDPGFGLEHSSGEGAPIVLEVRSHGLPMIFQHGQPIADLTYAQMTGPSEKTYGQARKNSYANQELKLPPWFD